MLEQPAFGGPNRSVPAAAAATTSVAVSGANTLDV